MKWYRKIAVELLIGIAVVNAHFIYKELSGRSISITDFRKNIIESLLSSDETENVPQTHTFAKRDGSAVKTRKYCRGCYTKKQQPDSSKTSVRKVTTYCADCKGEPHFCLACFTFFFFYFIKSVSSNPK